MRLARPLAGLRLSSEAESEPHPALSRSRPRSLCDDGPRRPGWAQTDRLPAAVVKKGSTSLCVGPL